MKYIYIAVCSTVISGILLAASGQAISQSSGSSIISKNSAAQNSVKAQTNKSGSAITSQLMPQSKGSSQTASSTILKSVSPTTTSVKVSGSSVVKNSAQMSYTPILKAPSSISGSSANTTPIMKSVASVVAQKSLITPASGSSVASGSATTSGAAVLNPSILVPDYLYFYQGVTAYQAGNYAQAVSVFSTFKSKFPNSVLVSSTYLDYYLAKAYYGNKQYSLAIQSAGKTTYAPFEMTYLIGQSYADLGQNSSATTYLSKLFFNGYVSSGATYEKMALQTLSKIDPYYTNIIGVMYNKNFTLLSSVDVPELEKIANYFIGLSDFSSALTVDNYLLDQGSDSYIAEQKLLCLYSLKQYQVAINYGISLSKTGGSDTVNYYIGVCYSRLGELENAIKWLSKIKNSGSITTKNQLIGRYYYLLKNYSTAVTYLQNQTDSNSLQMLIDCYQQLGDTSDAQAAINKLLATSPTLDLSAYYRYTLYKQTGKISYLNDIIKYNINSFYYEYALTQLKTPPKVKNYPISTYTSQYSDVVNQVQALINMQFYTGAMLVLQNSDLQKKHKTFYTYLTIEIYQGQGYYGTALYTAIQNYQEFYKYDNLFTLLYPRYYLSSVTQAAQSTGLSPALIFAIIRQESGFNGGAISPASAYGLMQMTVPTAKAYDSSASIQKLLDPDFNVEVGSLELKYLMGRYNGNILKVAAAYNAGPAAVDKWQSAYGVVTDDNIPYQETQNYVRKVVNNYDKYNRLYYTQSNAVGTFLIEPDSPTIQVTPAPPGAPSGSSVVPNTTSSQINTIITTALQTS